MLRVTENESGRGKTNDESALDRLAREGAQRMLAEVLEAEVDAYTERHRKARGQDGHALVVRNGRAQARRVPEQHLYTPYRRKVDQGSNHSDHPPAVRRSGLKGEAVAWDEVHAERPALHDNEDASCHSTPEPRGRRVTGGAASWRSRAHSAGSCAGLRCGPPGFLHPGLPFQ